MANIRFRYTIAKCLEARRHVGDNLLILTCDTWEVDIQRAGAPSS
jgi:hypothetical protein